MLKVRNLEAGYGKLRVLKNVSMHVMQGEIVTIIGANGAGKTTLLAALAGIIPGKGGSVFFNDTDIFNKSAEDIVSLGCSLVPEGRQIFSTMTVKENLVLGFYPLRKKYKTDINSGLEKIYSMFPILKERADQLAGTLSGGEQQMLAIGRALMSRPRLLMLDEPSIGLAPIIVQNIFSAICQLRKDNVTILLVEQNAKAALGVADRGYVMETGQIVLEGTADDLFNNKDVQRAYLGKDYKSIAE